MKKIAVVYTSMGGLVTTLKKTLVDVTGCRVISIADDSLIQDVMKAGHITDSVRSRMTHYYEAAADSGADLVISACSSVGDIAKEAEKSLKVPLLRIDHAMICKSLEAGNRIGVLASLGTTMDPTVRYVQQLAAEAGKTVTVVGLVADGAYEANSSGHPELHDALLEKAACKLAAEVDVIMLAQGSMSRMEQRLHELTSIPVYSSPQLCAEEAKRILEEQK